MRCLERNKRTLYYASVSFSDTLDEYGNATGGKSYRSAQAVAFRANVSPERGNYQRMAQGVVDNTEKVIVTSDTSCPIKEDYAIWMDVPVTSRHNYIVTAVERSINSITIRVRRVYMT